MNKELQDKYAKAWCDTNCWEIPDWMKPFNLHGILYERDKALFSSGAWKVLDAMLTDGLITEEAVNHFWSERINDKSSIKKGKKK